MKKIKMRIFAGFLALCLLAGLLPATAWAAGSEAQTDEQSWADCVTAPPDGYQDDDSGSSVKISSAEGLAWFARLVNQGDSFAGKTVVLTNSLDLSAHQWVPIGTSQHPFAGTFDGKGNTISGMTMAVSEAVPLAGLFGVVSTAAIQNVVLAESTVSGSATGTKEAACELKIGGIAATNTEKIPVTVKNCTVELSVTLATTGYVTVNIGGVLGYVEDGTGSYATITDTNVSLSMQQTAEEGFYRTMAGAAIGSLNNSKNTTTIQNCSLSLSGTMTGGGFISGYPSGSTAGAVIQIGGAVGVTPTTGSGSEPPVVLLERTSCDSTLDFTGAEETLESFTTLCDTEIGGFFGRASYSTIRSSFAKMELKSQTENGYFGNIAGNWADIREAEWSNVYTYAVQAGKQCTRPVHTTNPNWPKAQDVYYIVPNELTEHQSGVPFSYQTYDNDNYKTTPGINDGFTYSDGDAEDGITVTPSADGKMVTIAPANEQCAVRGVLELSSGYTIDFVLPVPVYPVGGGTYAITCEAKDLTSSGYTSCKVATAPEGKAKAGDLVTITAKPIPKDIKLVDSVTVTTSDGTPVAVEKTTGSIIGDQTYTFTMPASDVTVTGVFRKSSTEFTLSPNPVEFYVYEGYTSDDVEPITVTITNTGDLDVTFEGKYALPTSEYYDIQPADGPWRGENGGEITIQPGRTATFTVVPNPGLTSDFNPNTEKPVFYSTEQERVYLTLHCTVTEAPTYMLSASPASLTFEALYEGETPSAGKTVTLSNTGTGSLDVQLPTSEHFEVTAGDGWSGGTASLAPGENATVTITPKGRLSIGTYTDSIRFTTNHSATYVDVTASFTVLQHEDIRITPANITVYTGGEGYTGMVDDSGNLGSTTNGLPEPGYYITLPEALNEQLGGADHAADLSDILTLTYDDGNGTTREWKLELYGTDAHSTDVEGVKTARYIYRLLPGVDENGQKIPVRLQLTDPETDQIIVSDQFSPVLGEPYREYIMSIYSGGLTPSRVTAQVTLGNGQIVSCGVITGTGKVVIRGLTGENATSNIVSEESSLPADALAALTSDPVTYYVNGSNVEVDDPSGVRLLVDDVLDDTVLTEYIQQQMTDKIPAGSYAYEQKYLDLVDTKNGNAYLTMGENDVLTLYWPIPSDLDDDGTFYIVHFDALERNYDNLDAALAANAPDVVPSSLVTVNGRQYITFDAASFSPFVLVYERESNSGGTVSYSIQASAGEGGSITPSGQLWVLSGSNRTFTIEADEGYELADVLVDGKSVGAVEHYTFESVRKNHTIQAVFKPVGQPVGPDDTGVSDWLDTQNHSAYLIGYPNGTFGPNRSMTRAEVAQMFYNLLLNQNVVISRAFTDVPAGVWYAKAVSTLASLGIVNGVGNQRYAPDRSITRAEFTTIAMRFAHLDTSGKNIFSDVTESDWFYPYVTGSIQYGWINGYADGTFRPNCTITRAEVTAIVNRMLGRCADEDYGKLHEDQLRAFSDLEDSHWAYWAIVEATNRHTYTKQNGTEDWTGLSAGK